MAKITVKIIDNEKEWESFLTTRPEASFLQSWYWGKFHLNYGNKIIRTGFYVDNSLKGVMLSIVESAKRGRYLTVPGGPVIDWQSKKQIKFFVEEIKRIAGEERCVFVRVRPQLKSDDFSKAIFAENGFINAPSHLHAELTSQLDISLSQEEILAKMRKTTRYEIKKAISLGIKVNVSDDPKTIKQFYDLEVLTSKRQGFVPFSYSFLFEQFKVFSEAGKALIYRAEFENKLLAQAFIIFYGQEAAYHYGASTQEARQYPGAYLIQWEAIKEAKKRGIKIYNFWGVAPEDQKEHRFYNLSIFKRGFGGSNFEYLHAQDLVINRSLYLFDSTVEKIRKKIRRI